MYAYDFEYDGHLLSDFGFMICHFDASRGVTTTESGSEISFETAPVHSGKRNIAVGTNYENCLSTTFQICKNPKMFDDDEMVITTEEFRILSRWLNRREFLWFHSFDWCNPEVIHPWFRASFKLSKIEFANENVGVELEITTDAPFGYGQEIVKTFNFTDGNLAQTFEDKNDEIGETYPQLTVVCGEAGTWTLSDDITGCFCEVQNCLTGETLTFSGDSMVIDTDSVTHINTLANDFNYDFFRFANTYENRLNTFTATMPCTVELRYRPIWKDTL